MSDDAPLLACRDLTVAWKGRVLVDRFRCELRAGEIVAVEGPSGCGKTSLLRRVCGLDDPAPGSVHWRGRPAAEVGWPVVRSRVVLVAQEPVLLPGTVRENLALPLRYRAVKRPFREEAARDLLARLRLPEAVLDATADELSVGERQRVCLARALLLEPEVLLLDEPTSALDPATTAVVEALVRERVRAGAAALVVTHHPEQAARWCDRRLPVGGGNDG